MPTTITHTIGASKQYADLPTWAAAMVALYPNLVTSNVALVANVYADGTGTNGEYEYSGGSNYCDLTGFTTGAGNGITIQAATGQGINSQGASLTQLAYSPTNGVAINSTDHYAFCFALAGDYISIIGIQFQGQYHAGFVAGGGAQTNCLISQCLHQNNPLDDGVFYSASSTNMPVISQCVMVTSNGINAINAPHYASGFYVVGCTALCPSDATFGAAGYMVDNYSYGGGGLFEDNLCLGFASGMLRDSIDFSSTAYNNASDLNISGWGTGNQSGLTASSQVVNLLTASLDARLKIGSACIGTGKNDPTYNPTDIAGQMRANPPCIGAWELITAGPATLPYIQRKIQPTFVSQDVIDGAELFQPLPLEQVS